jgi:hypothetical protein
MLQQRPFSPNELLAWCRLMALSLAGSAMAYAKDRDGSVDGLVQFWSERLAGLSMGVPGGGVESALLGLLLNVEALGGEITSRSVNPEGAEVVVKSLPGERVVDEVEHRFEVALTEEDLLTVAGVTREELNHLLDVFGTAAAGAGFEFLRAEEDGNQHLTMRVW